MHPINNMYWLFILYLLIPWHLAISSSSPQSNDHQGVTEPSDPVIAAQLYAKAMAILNPSSASTDNNNGTHRSNHLQHCSNTKPYLAPPKPSLFSSSSASSAANQTVADAIELLQQAILVHGHEDSMIALADCAFYGLYGTGASNYRTAFSLYRRAAREHGSVIGHRMLGLCYSFGLGTDANEALSLLHYTFAADADDFFALAALGYRYGNGLGVAQDMAVAVAYWSRAAAQVAAAYRAGNTKTFPRMRLVEEDLRSGLGVLTGATVGGGAGGAGAAGAGGAHGAANHHGHRGHGAAAAAAVPARREDALQFYRYNADRGDEAAQLLIAQVFLLGSDGFEQDYRLAHHYLSLAAAQGNVHAKGLLGLMLLKGEAPPSYKPDPHAAHPLLAEAAKEGIAAGLYGMGCLMEEGLQAIPSTN